MLIKQNTNIKTVLLLVFITLTSQSHIYGRELPKKITYYLYITDFAKSFIQIPTSNLSVNSVTIASSYLAGRAPIYDMDNKKVGTCSASFLNMQTSDGIFTDIANYLAADNGLIVTWFTPTTLINLELDSIIRSMVTKCRVIASTKVGFNPYFGRTFNLVVSSDSSKIYFKFTELPKRKRNLITQDN